MSDLIEIPVTELMEGWRPGSQGDDWTWSYEYVYCWMSDGPRTTSIIERVKNEGIGFDDIENPITLGDDGRVWDGHHRILIARYLGIETVKVRKV